MGTISATFKSTEEATGAINELIGMGVDKSEMSVLMSEQVHKEHFAGDTKDGGTIKGVDVVKSSKGIEGAAAGAAVGGAAGAIYAGLAAVGAIAAPGIGLVVAGPAIAALAGAGAGGVGGGLIGWLVGMGFNEHQAKVFADEVKAGSILVAVNSDRDNSTIKKVLEKHNGKTSTTFTTS